MDPNVNEIEESSKFLDSKLIIYRVGSNKWDETKQYLSSRIMLGF